MKPPPEVPLRALYRSCTEALAQAEGMDRDEAFLMLREYAKCMDPDSMIAHWYMREMASLLDLPIKSEEPPV